MRQSLDAGRALQVMPEPTIADGLSAPMAGERNFAIVQRYVDDVVLVSEDEIKHAMRMLLSRCKLVAEGAGAAATAALLAGRIPMKGTEKVVAIMSGGNIDLARLSGILV
jgi:threonine dehydratase